MIPHRRLFTAFLLITVSLALHAGTTVNPRPNVVLLLADDLGYMDINAYATHTLGVAAKDQYYETPNLDRLISQGTAYSQAYACQLCSPTRAGILTGRNAAKIGVTTATPNTVRTYYNQGLEPPKGYLAHDAIFWVDTIHIPQSLLNGSTLEALPSGQPLDQGRDEITLAEALPGYRSAFIGKWHLGGHGAKGWQPHDQGFEELAYLDEGSSTYFNWRKSWSERTKPTHLAKMPQPEWCVGKTDAAAREGYLTDALTETAVNFVQAQAAATNTKPFFLYLCHFAVHTPFQAKPEAIKHFEHKPTRGWNGQSNAVYAAMLKSLDDSVGRLMDTLKQTGMESNTLVIFMSDNGGVTYSRPAATCNTPLKGGKAMLFEGGIRVPLLFRQPGQVPAHQWCNVAVSYEDIFPTILDAVGIDPTPHHGRIDGRSLKSLFKDTTNQERGYPRDTFYWHYPFNVAVKHPEDGLPLTPSSSIRRGDYKLIYDWSGRLWLYDLKNDWREEHNLAEVRPDKAQALFTDLNRWLDENVAVKYTPAINPRYSPNNEVRANPFLDLRQRMLGDAHAIRKAASDARLESDFNP
jgi:arylsulfatase A-like enzyme